VQRLVGRDIDKLRVAIWLAFLTSGIGYVIFGASGWLNWLWLGCVALFVAHFGGGITWAISSVMLQSTTPDRLRGRVFAADFGLSTLTTGTSTLLFGLALQAQVSPMLLALVGALLFSAYGMAWGITTSRGKLAISEASVAEMLEHMAGENV